MTHHTWDSWRFGSGTRKDDVTHSPVFDDLIGPALHSLQLTKALHVTLPGAYILENGV